MAGSHRSVESTYQEEEDDTTFVEEEQYPADYPDQEAYVNPRNSNCQVKGGPLNPAAVLAAHNRWRKAVAAPPLKWSEHLAQTAQQWADYLSSSGGCLIQHSHSGYGENIFQAAAICWSDGRSEIQRKTIAEIVDGWASEINDYDYATNSCVEDCLCGHYTQIIWKQTTEVGCAISVCPSKKQIWVCHYSPPGNVEGQRPY